MDSHVPKSKNQSFNRPSSAYFTIITVQ